MIRKHLALFVNLIACSVAVLGSAQPSNEVGNAGSAASLRPVGSGKLGDPAPPITVYEWIKGKPVRIQTGTNQTGTNIYILVFCQLTRANEFALTNLSALQKQYGDKGVITVVISPESPAVLKTFILDHGKDVNYTVAADDMPDRTARNYLQAFGVHQLPRAFVVGKDGKVLWHGHPLTDGLGRVVDEVVSGRYDLAAEAKRLIPREEMAQYLFYARQDDPAAEKYGRMLLTIRTNDAVALCELASKIATDPSIPKRDVALATEALDRAKQLASTNGTDIAITRAILLFQTGRQDEGLAQAQKALTEATSDDAKEEARICVHAMEARLAALKNARTTPGGVTTNAFCRLTIFGNFQVPQNFVSRPRCRAVPFGQLRLELVP